MNANTEETSINNLITELRDLIKHQLNEIAGEFYETTDTALFELANEAGSNVEQKQYFELLQVIRMNKPMLISDLQNKLGQRLKPISELSGDGFNFEVEDDDDAELSLVSQDTMEEMVLINTINAKTSDKFSESIGKLAVRLNYLAERSDAIFASDALSPMNFCTGFKESIEGLDVTISDKLILYKLYDNEVTSQLDKLYDLVNKRLIDAGILPKIKLHQQSVVKSADGRKNIPQYETIEEEPETDAAIEEGATGGPGGAGGQARASGSASPAGGGTSPSGGSWGGMAGDDNVPAQAPASAYMTADNAASSMPASDYANAAPSDQSASAEPGLSGRQIGGYPVERMNQVIRDYIGNTDPAAGSYEGSTQFYGHRDVLSALTQMQAEASTLEIAETPVIEKIDAAQIKQALVSTIAGQQGGTVTKQVDKVIDKTIDFIKLIFDAIIEDQNISDTIKALLLTLQIPIIKASMIDHEFFIDDEHPARQLLDRIAELGVGVSSREDAVFIQINTIVRTLLEEYVEDINAFVTALAKVEAIISRREEEAAEQERKAQLEVQKVHARKTVLRVLRKSTYGKKLPAAVHKLVLKLWPTLMFNHYLNHGKQNDEWITQVTIMQELIDSLQPPKNDEQYDHLHKTHIVIATRVEKQLNNCKIISKHIGEAISDLRETYQQLLDDYVPSQQPAVAETPEITELATTVQPEQSEPMAPAVNEPQTDPVIEQEELVAILQKDKLKLLTPDVRPGVWFQITLDNGRIRRLKLSIIVIDDALLVFVDHDGNRVVEKEADEFADDLREGRASLIMSHSVFDHALTTAYEAIK